MYGIVIDRRNATRYSDAMNSTNYAAKELQTMTVGCTKVINGKSVTRWSAERWEVGTFAKQTATAIIPTLLALGFSV